MDILGQIRKTLGTHVEGWFVLDSVDGAACVGKSMW